MARLPGGGGVYFVVVFFNVGLVANVADVSRELEARERAARRHTVWALLGVSPAAAIPLVATASEFGMWALLAGMTAVALRETLGAVRAHRDVAELREKLHSLTCD